MLRLSEPLTAKIRLLRDLDSKIDFARSTIQLHIVFALVMSREPLTPTRIAELLEERRKAVLDALRKLELKGIIVRKGARGGENLYALSEEGKRYAERLLSFLGIGKSLKIDTSETDSSGRAVIVKKLTEAHHIYKAVVFLANAPGMKLSLRKLSELMGLSPERAKSYLDVFSRPPIRIFRRIGGRGEGVYYKLEEKGLALYKRLPDYQVLKNSMLERIRLKTMLILGRRISRGLLVPALASLVAMTFTASLYLGGHLVLGVVSLLLLFFLCMASLILP